MVATPGTALQVGDRLPNLLVREEGLQLSIYQRHQGRRMVFGFGPLDPALLNQVAERLNAEPVMIVAAGSPSNSALSIQADSALQAALAGGMPVGVVLIEPSLRVLARLAAQPHADLADRAELAWRRAAEFPQQVTVGVAPALLVARIFEPELCAAVRAHYDQVGGRPSGVIVFEQGQQKFTLDPKVKMRHETVIQDRELEALVHSRIEQRLLPEIDRAFSFQVQQREHFKIIRYEAGAGYFRCHRDNDTPDVAHRRFAMTLNLNTGEYRGGCLRFPEFGDLLYEAPAGGALIFSCSLLHEVTDITEGARMAMTSFFS